MFEHVFRRGLGENIIQPGKRYLAYLKMGEPKAQKLVVGKVSVDVRFYGVSQVHFEVF